MSALEHLTAFADACRSSPALLSPGVVVAIAVALGVLALSAWLDRRARFPGASAFRWLRAATVAWVLLQGAEIAAVAPACKLWWGMNAWPAIIATPLLSALFLRRYALGRAERLPPALVAALVAIPLAAWAAALTNPWHGLLYGAGTGPVDEAMGAPLRYARGPLFWLLAGVAYAAMALGVLTVARAASACHGRMRRLMLSLLAIAAVPWAANAAYIGLGMTLLGTDPTPRSFAVSLLLTAWAIRRHGLFDLAPIARSTLVDAIPDPVLVLDAAGRVVDANPAAQRLGAARATGQRLREWPAAGVALDAALGSLAAGVGGPAVELRLADRVYEVERVGLGGRGRVQGLLLRLRDVTERQRAQDRLVDALARRDESLRAITRLHEQLREQARRDPLTGLLNRRGLEECFERAREAAARGDSALGLAVIDVDHFKRINDTHGHAVGDEALLGVARRLRAAVGEHAFRLGGEEFVVLMPGLALEAALARADALRTAVGERPVECGAVRLPCTVSVGVAQWRRDGDALTELVRAADAALYQAKAAGRDRVAAADGPGGSGPALATVA